MGSRWTAARVLGLAPDAGSARAARALARPRQWSALGSNSSLVWGKCQGSAREPYQVTVDLNEPAFRCTCPSRKFPCKHGLALLLMWAANDGSVADLDAAADFAQAWAHDRADRSARQAARASGEGPDPEAQAKRVAERESLMTAGLDEFERWLFDLVRQGLAGVRRQPPSFWDTAAARLVDAQMPGLAERVRTMGSAVHVRADWAPYLLAQLGRWYLAVRAWRRRAALSPATMGDLRAVLGWSRRQDEVLAGERLRDRWWVIGAQPGGGRAAAVAANVAVRGGHRRGGGAAGLRGRGRCAAGAARAGLGARRGAGAVPGLVATPGAAGRRAAGHPGLGLPGADDRAGRASTSPPGGRRTTRG